MPLLILHSAKCLHSPDEQLNSLASSLDYVAPEILNNTGHGKSVDIWATGIPCFSARTTRFILSALAIITYMLLCGYNPFRADNTATLAQQAPIPKLNSRVRTATRFPIKPNALSAVSPLSIRSTIPPPTRLYMISGLPTCGPTLISPYSQTELESLQLIPFKVFSSLDAASLQNPSDLILIVVS